MEKDAGWAGQIDQARFQQRLQDAATIAGRVAHGFDNVLTGILGFAELSMTQMPAGPTRQYLNEVLQAAQLGTQLTQEMHQFSRCGTLRPSPTALSLVVADEEQRVRSALGPGQDLRISIPPDLPGVALDAEPLTQLLSQLLNNALESLPGEGEITLSAGRAELGPAACRTLLGNPAPGPFIEIVITDTGTGLSPEARQRLFVEPFFSSKPRHRGLGLAMVYRIVQVHRGGFLLEPAAKGGTVARVYLPPAPASLPAREKPPTLA